MTGSVLIIVLATKFTHGALPRVIAMPILYLDHAFGSASTTTESPRNSDLQTKGHVARAGSAIVLVSKIPANRRCVRLHMRGKSAVDAGRRHVSVDPGTQRRWRRTGNVAAFPCH